MEKILRGVQQFQDEVFRDQHVFFEHLAAKQQKPRALFITCSDSRVHPNLITQTEPGDLFLLRNAGNIVPPYGAGAGGEAATIEYAVAVLGVKHIVICGHSQCGAMKALMSSTPEDHKDLHAVNQFFSYAYATKRIIDASCNGADEKEKWNAAIHQNVLVQIDNLRTHPAVAARLFQNELEVHGWVYSIESGVVDAYDYEARTFRPLHETYSAVLARSSGPAPTRRSNPVMTA